MLGLCFVYAVSFVLSSFGIISLRKKRWLPTCIVFLVSCGFYCGCFFPMVQRVGLQCVIEAFLGQTCLLLENNLVEMVTGVRGTLLYGDVDRSPPSRSLDVSRNRKTKAAIYMKIYLA